MRGVRGRLDPLALRGVAGATLSPETEPLFPAFCVAHSGPREHHASSAGGRFRVTTYPQSSQGSPAPHLRVQKMRNSPNWPHLPASPAPSLLVLFRLVNSLVHGFLRVRPAPGHLCPPVPSSKAADSASSGQNGMSAKSLSQLTGPGTWGGPLCGAGHKHGPRLSESQMQL